MARSLSRTPGTRRPGRPPRSRRPSVIPACRRPPAAAPRRFPRPSGTAPDILLITVDTLRADAPGYSGNASAATPNIDRLAGGGGPSSGAHAHNVDDASFPRQHPDGPVPLRARRARQRRVPSGPEDADPRHAAPSRTGYSTAAVIGAFPLDARFGLDRGFDAYDEKYPQGANEYDFRVAERPASEVVVARRWWAATPGDRVFSGCTSTIAIFPIVPPAAHRGPLCGRPVSRRSGGRGRGARSALRGPAASSARRPPRPDFRTTARPWETTGKSRTVSSPTRRRCTFRSSCGVPDS